MRSPHGASGGTETPIYDALCSEYQRLFKTLPGDRQGEEDLRFNAFDSKQTAQNPNRYGRHRGNRPAALPPGRTGNRMREL